jgi:DNA phosphorothioation-dependent restriction protein DptH
VHSVSQIKGQEIQSILNPDNKSEQEAFMQQIREVDKHYSLYVDGDKKVSKIENLAFWQLT